MVYIILSGQVEGEVSLVKGEDDEGLELPLVLRQGQRVVGCLTDKEQSALNNSEVIAKDV